MYPWQAAALECGSDGSNLVYCAPTSGGKSLVAEVLLLRALLASRNPRACRYRGDQVCTHACTHGCCYLPDALM
jgi:DNA polymerase theta